MAGRYNASQSARHVIQDGIGELSLCRTDHSGRCQKASWLTTSLGHSYLVEPTKCYASIAKKYFENGVLPDEFETYCEEK